MKNIFLLGASGSIGRQVIQIIQSHPQHFALKTVSVGKNVAFLEELMQSHPIEIASVEFKEDQIELQKKYPDVKIYSGEEGLIYVAAKYHKKGVLVNAVSGMIGLVPTLRAIEQGHTILLANKETLVVAGDIVLQHVKKYDVTLLPIDSEHNAIFQALHSGKQKEVRRIILTASGGAFRDLDRKALLNITKEQALNHPNWNMGDKITIDSATMANKGLEVIEAHHLFDLDYDKIETIIHKESIIHSMVEFVDKSIIAQMSQPSMLLPIAYAMFYPDRIPTEDVMSLDFTTLGTLHFQKMDYARYPLLKLAYDVGKAGGTLPAIYNASNEVAVSLFLKGKISFLDIEDIVINTVRKAVNIDRPTLEEILEVDRQVRKSILEIYEVK